MHQASLSCIPGSGGLAPIPAAFPFRVALSTPGGGVMNTMSRRAMLTSAAAGGLLAAAATAHAQATSPVPQPQRPGEGGTDPGPRNIARDRQNPDLLVPPATDHGTLPNLRFSF